MSFSLLKSYLEVATPAAILVFAVVTVLWLLSIKLRDVSIVDIWWGPGFALLFFAALWGHGEQHPRAWLLLALVATWGLRMGVYFSWRNIGHGEDRRYTAMRDKRQDFVFRSFGIVFLLQGFLQLFISMPLFGTILSSEPLWWLDFIGCAILLAGILIEAIADWQLARFKGREDSAGKVLDQGLWAWSRHPNYFGNAVIWLGIGVVATAAGAAPWTWLGPVLMWFLLIRVSGVAMLEETIVERRPAYADYIANVPAFIPRPPRRRS